MSNDPGNVPVYKVVIAGDGNVGKTSLVRRYCEGKFDQSRIMTLGVDFQTKLVTLDQTTVKLSIWDVAGQDRFLSFRDTFYQGAHAVALVYDVTAPFTFFNLMHWRDEIQSIVPLVPMVVIGNKSDLHGVVPPDESRGWAKSLNMPFLLTSAATGDNVEQFFAGLAYLSIQELQRRRQVEDEERTTRT
ncbi:MAG TPA: Rab family GTPase [Aggregatilineales bacterium]|nr:Rab family GTPase [Aggregatilineales bacterium]